MQIEHDGFYLDGKTARRQRAALRLTPSGLEIRTEEGATFTWPYPEIRQAQGKHAGEQIRLERGGETPEVLLVTEEAFWVDLHRIAPTTSRRFLPPQRPGRRIRMVVLAACGSVLLSAGIYLWGIPAVVRTITPWVPVPWEEALGKAAIDALAPSESRCREPSGLQAIDRIFTPLIAPLPDHPFRFQIIVVDEPIINALAAPGGYLILYRGLLEAIETPEALAGVLAHEVEHVLLRHTTQSLLQDASIGLLIAAVSGEISGAMAFALESARTLGRLEYSRRNEIEADREGMRLLMSAGIDPSGMIAFFEMLKKKGPKIPGSLRYLSTHPTTDERLARLRQLARLFDGSPQPLLEDDLWKKIETICDHPSDPK